ncbi:MAG: hypothetical protein MJ237_02410 [bacterium]|nr:hypothetical protein [bacterium]
MKIKFIQKIIDKLRNKIGLMSSIITRSILIPKINSCKSLYIGSSHLTRFIPNKNEINIAMPSVDLYYTYNIYNKYNAKNIDNVIVSFSVFTPGASLIMTYDSDLCISLKLLFDIPYQYPDVAKKKKLYQKEKYAIKQIEKYKKRLKLPPDYRGEFLSYKDKEIDKNKTIQRAKGHYKNNQRENSQMEYCLKLIEETKQNNQNLIFVLPPATEIYKSAIPSSDVLFKVLYDMVKDFDHVKVINLYDDLDFKQEDFMDGDHLNYQGAVKFTQKVRERL